MLWRKVLMAFVVFTFIFTFMESFPVLAADIHGDCGAAKIDSGLGCIPIEQKEFTTWLLNAVFGIAGGIAFLLMVYGFIVIATSGGDEKKIAGGTETVTSALMGLIFCIFSVFILRLIMLDILQIPGL